MAIGNWMAIPAAPGCSKGKLHPTLPLRELLGPLRCRVANSDAKSAGGRRGKEDQIAENSRTSDEQGIYPKCTDTEALLLVRSSPLGQVEAWINKNEAWHFFQPWYWAIFSRSSGYNVLSGSRGRDSTQITPATSNWHRSEEVTNNTHQDSRHLSILPDEFQCFDKCRSTTGLGRRKKRPLLAIPSTI